MTAEAPSAVSAEESPQSVVDAGMPLRPLRVSSDGPDGSGSDGGIAPRSKGDGGPMVDGVSAPGADPLSYLSNGNGAHPNGSGPNGSVLNGSVLNGSTLNGVEPAGDEPATDELGSVEDRIETAEPDVAEPEAAESDVIEPEAAESDVIEPEVAAPADAVEAHAADIAETDIAETYVAEPEPAEVEPEPAVEPARSTVEVAAEVAEQLGSVVGEDVEADPAEFAAAAVLDVLRAAGWADATEAAELRAEATRLRELLSEVIRDHRAREASAAGGQNQQLYWLVPLLRAAHGVAFGSLGAKVALRTAVQEVPPDVLATAGLRIDYGVEPAYEDQ